MSAENPGGGAGGNPGGGVGGNPGEAGGGFCREARLLLLQVSKSRLSKV